MWEKKTYTATNQLNCTVKLKLNLKLEVVRSHFNSLDCIKIMDPGITSLISEADQLINQLVNEQNSPDGAKIPSKCKSLTNKLHETIAKLKTIQTTAFDSLLNEIDPTPINYSQSQEADSIATRNNAKGTEAAIAWTRIFDALQVNVDQAFELLTKYINVININDVCNCTCI